MRRTILALTLVAGLNTAWAADDLAVVGQVDFGFKSLDLDTGTTANVLSASYVSINPSVAFGYRSFYSSLSYERSLSADPSAGQNTAGTTATTTDFSRSDSTFTLGYRLNDAFSLFAGYTKGANHFTQTTAAVVLVVSEIDYTESGPFAGLAYTASFKDKGNLGLSVGYADLDGELRTHTRPTNTVTDVTGDTTGLSYALTWSGPLSGSLGYRLGAKYTRYEMEEPSKIVERYRNFFFGLTNYF